MNKNVQQRLRDYGRHCMTEAYNAMMRGDYEQCQQWGKKAEDTVDALALLASEKIEQVQ